jgi:putative FmdB family regulatory protein
MPTYEYRCKSCGNELEVQQSFTDDPLTECPSCGEVALKKVFGNIAVTFKGSGFYKTDSRTGGGSSSTTSSESSSSSSETKTDTKTETKSETKSSDTKSSDSSSSTAAAS